MIMLSEPGAPGRSRCNVVETFGALLADQRAALAEALAAAVVDGGLLDQMAEGPWCEVCQSQPYAGQCGCTDWAWGQYPTLAVR